MWMLDFKSHDPLCITHLHIYYCSVGQMTGFLSGVFGSVELGNFMLVDKCVELHTWLIYRQLAGSNGRFNVNFFKVMNKGCREKDSPTTIKGLE